MGATGVNGDGGDASPLRAFEGNITPPRISPFYTAGLVLVTFVMVLLPAVYIGLIVLVGWAVAYHLKHNAWILHGPTIHVAQFLLYAGPGVVGVILVFFMLKPLLARSAPAPKPISLDPAREPLLFAFVSRICQLVRAPVPSQIEIDWEANASARLRRGLLGRDLVLTIGLPLVAGMNMRQFAGVLAHEFGHFTQGAGMRLTYVIRQINHWFARVVYERDTWDLELERAAGSVDIRIAFVLHVARACIWLTRRILWAFMYIAHAVSCFMLRQMEYDADAYKAKVAGSDAFENTLIQAQFLGVAVELAVEKVRQSWTARRLPEDWPALVAHEAEALPAETRAAIARDAMSSKTRLFDTHPCTASRVRAARALNEPGVFRLERPARELFAEFDAACKRVTWLLYAKYFGLEFTEVNLVRADEFIRESLATRAAGEAARKFCGSVDLALVPLFTSATLRGLEGSHCTVEGWRSAVERTESLLRDAERVSEECAAAERRLPGLYAAKYLAAAGFKVVPNELGLPPDAKTISEQRAAATNAIWAEEAKVRACAAQLDEFMSALRCRVFFALRLGSGATGAGEARMAQEPVHPLLGTMASLGNVLTLVHEVRRRLIAFVLLATNHARHPDPTVVEAQLEKLAAELRELLELIHSRLGTAPYPFPHPRGQLTVADFARYEKPCTDQFERVLRNAEAHVEHLFTLYERVVGEILCAAARAEAALESGTGSTPAASTGSDGSGTLCGLVG
ncbi:MAG: M48 family metallopeptidase [Verrucomicrobiae bacterium]|nr:M48 family metallopeptidase [Verrucomicrobiae bacterium]